MKQVSEKNDRSPASHRSDPRLLALGDLYSAGLKKRHPKDEEASRVVKEVVIEHAVSERQTL